MSHQELKIRALNIFGSVVVGDYSVDKNLTLKFEKAKSNKFVTEVNKDFVYLYFGTRQQI